MLMGKTGSGKTTILESIIGLRRVSGGRIRLCGVDVTGLNPAVRGVGYVPQDPVFPAGLTAEDAVLAGLADVDVDERPGRLAVSLGRAGFNPRRVRTKARVHLDKVEAGFTITRIELAMEADVPEISADEFQRIANIGTNESGAGAGRSPAMIIRETPTVPLTARQRSRPRLSATKR